MVGLWLTPVFVGCVAGMTLVDVVAPVSDAPLLSLRGELVLIAVGGTWVTYRWLVVSWLAVAVFAGGVGMGALFARRRRSGEMRVFALWLTLQLAGLVIVALIRHIG